jgi:hypothetical protein
LQERRASPVARTRRSGRADPPRRKSLVYLTPKGRALEKQRLPYAHNSQLQALENFGVAEIDRVRRAILIPAFLIGAVHLIDDRYRRREVRDLLPRGWRVGEMRKTKLDVKREAEVSKAIKYEVMWDDIRVQSVSM